jgi:D-alanine-D-alanine ligase
MKIGLTYNLRGEGEDDRAGVADEDEEFDSPETIDAIAGVLAGGGHTVERLGFGRKMIDRLLASPPDAVFNIAEGYRGRSRESQVPALLEMFSIPYTGSDPLTLALTLDKDLAKKIVSSRGLKTPGHLVLDTFRPLTEEDLQGLRSPLLVKPSYEGSSKGIRLASKVTTPDEANEQARWLFADYGGPVMVEEFLDGPEFTVGILGNSPPRVLGVMMIRHRSLPPEDFLYSLEVKRDWENQVEYLVPPPVDDNLLLEIEELALGSYQALGCRDVSRVDIRLRDGEPYFLEVNPLPGLSPEYGDLVIMARKKGRSYESLVLDIFDHARERWEKDGRISRGA